MAADALDGVEALVSKIRVEVPASMHAFADAQAEAFTIARGELHDLLMEDLPSAILKGKIDQVMAEVDAKIAASVAETRANTLQVGTDNTESTAAEDEKAAKERERIQARLVMLDQSYFTELQNLQLKFDQELLLIQTAEENKLLLEDEARARRLRAEEKFQDAKAKLEESGGAF